MLKIEEYIARRKKEDSLSEFDLNSKNENIKTCVNYVFEYFNNYLPIDKLEERTVQKNDKVDKLRKQLDLYDPEVVDWLVEMYSDHEKMMHRIIGNAIEDEFFLLYNKDEEFRSVSYACYSKLIKRYPFLKDQTEMLYLFIKDYHRVKSNDDFPPINDEFDEWYLNTKTKYHVNLASFALEWDSCFYNNENSWPATHRNKSKYTFRKYDYNIKQKTNLFNLDSLYRKMPKKDFIKGHKQDLEILMMYYWLHDMEGDDEGYWQEYLENILSNI